MQLNVNLLAFKKDLIFKIKHKKRFIFCQIRKKNLVLGPEELVRQLMISYLIQEKNYNKNKIAVEKELLLNERRKRFDILIYNERMSPEVLIECKAPEVAIAQTTFEQISRYNLELKAPFLIVTNGLETYCCLIDFEKKDFKFLNEIPNF